MSTLLIEQIKRLIALGIDPQLTLAEFESLIEEFERMKGAIAEKAELQYERERNEANVLMAAQRNQQLLRLIWKACGLHRSGCECAACETSDRWNGREDE